MKRRHAIVAGLAAGVMASAGVLAAAARTSPNPQPLGLLWLAKNFDPVPENTQSLMWKGKPQSLILING